MRTLVSLVVFGTAALLLPFSAHAQRGMSAHGASGGFHSGSGFHSSSGFAPSGGFRSSGSFAPRSGFAPSSGFRSNGGFAPRPGFAPRSTNFRSFAPRGSVGVRTTGGFRSFGRSSAFAGRRFGGTIIGGRRSFVFNRFPRGRSSSTDALDLYAGHRSSLDRPFS